MRGTFRVRGRVARLTVRIEALEPTDGVDVTDVMLQPGDATGWTPHVSELPWSAGVP